MDRQWRFAPPRRWRFDLACPVEKVAIEIHGQTWANGRHNRGYGMQGDFEKNNAAVLDGWRVLYFTGDDIQKRLPQAIETIVAAMNSTPQVQTEE
jgi:very-short-patch-repair endonuclease